MRKTSQDGADTTSITSAIENEVKKAPGLKTKRTSIKRKMPNFSHESDDTVIEPLLQAEREKSDNNRSAKFLMSKSKTDSGSERSDNVFVESKVQKCSPTSTTPLSENIPYTSKVKEAPVAIVTAPIHNHMNTNVFGGHEVTKVVPTKSAVIVEIEKSRGSTYTPGPLIFTTAKIHTDNKTKQMEPVQVTPVPILSTIEGSLVKSVAGVIDSGEKRQELIQPKTDVQRKETKESELKTMKPGVSTKDSSHTATSNTDINLKTIVVSCKNNTINSPTTTTVPPKPSQNLFEKSSIQKDSRTPITSLEKVDVSSKPSTTTKSEIKALQHGEIRDPNVDKTKKCVTEKLFGEVSSFEFAAERNVKSGKGKTPVSNGDFKELSPNGVSSFKPETTLSKESVVTSVSSDSKSHDKSTKATGTLSINKQLQRQKKTTVEDVSEPGIHTKGVDCGRVDNSTSSKDQSNKTNVSVKAVSENKVKSSVHSQSLPKTTVETRSIVSTSSAKPSTQIPEKTSLVTSASTVLPNFATSAKTPGTSAKNVVSDKDNSKSITKPTSDISKSENVMKPLKKDISTNVKKGTDIQAVATQSLRKETSSDVKKGTDIQAVASQSLRKETSSDVKKGTDIQAVASQSLRKETSPDVKKGTDIQVGASQSLKMPESSKTATKTLNARVGSHISDTHKIAGPPVTCVSSSTGSTGNKCLASQVLDTGKSSTTSTTLPSTSSAKTLIASNKKIEPLFSERNKDNRA